MDPQVNDVAYWREQAELYKRNWEEEQEELKEFQISSKDLETELEAQLEALETSNTKLKAQIERMAIEGERYEAGAASMNRQMAGLQEEVTSLKSERLQNQQYIRKMEQTNDDLERSNRSALASISDFEDRLNQLLERNALLEVELDEKEELNVNIQRLKDEVRDLNQELVIRRAPAIGESFKPSKDASVCVQIMRNTLEASTQTIVPSAVTAGANRTLNPTARIAALNLVNDLLQKVALLEANLTHVCQCYDVTPAKLIKMNGTSTMSSTNGV